MVGINFSANRFHSNVDSSSSVNTEANADKSESHVNEQSNIETLMDNEYLKITHFPTLNSVLENGETILDAKATNSKIATIITTKRILVYNLKSKYPCYFECVYTPNKFNLLPLCVVIPNSIYELKPDLIVLDPVSGLLKFYESIKMGPSLGGLQNIKSSYIKVNNAEFLTDITLFQNNGLLLSTSQCRVLYVKLKDHLRDTPFNYFEIYNNRPLVSFMLSQSYSIRGYNNFNRIVSLKLYNVTPMEKHIVILESSGRLSFIKHLIGSTTFTLERKIEVNVLSDIAEGEYLDFELSVRKQLCVVLLKNSKSSPYFGLAMNLGEAQKKGDKVLKFDIPYISLSGEHVHPKIFFAKNDEVCVIESSNKLLFFEPRFDMLDTVWTQLVTLKESLEIFSMEKVDENMAFLNTNDGNICITLKKIGMSNDWNLFLEQNIIQFLKYGTESTKIIYDLKDMGIPIDQTILKGAIRRVSNCLISNTSLVTGTNTSEILRLKTHFYLKLIKFTFENCDLEDDSDLKNELVTNCHLISLASGLFQLTFEEKYAESIQDCLRLLGWSDDYRSMFVQRASDIVALLDQFISSMVSSCTANNLFHLAESLSTLSVSYINCDFEIRKYIKQTGLCRAFVRNCEVFESLNILIKRLYEMNKERTSDANNFRYCDVLLKLTHFLYCVTSETVFYLSRTKGDSVNDFNHFLNSNKENWTLIYIALNRQSDMIPLAVRYNDMEVLAILVESKRELLLSNKNNSELLGKDTHEEFDYYFDCYGYDFGKALFRHYVVTNKVNVLLSCFSKHSEFLERFLSSDIRFYKFGWIHDTQIAAFDKVCDTLLTFVTDSDYTLNNSLHDMKLQMSLGKLSAVCDKRTDSEFERFTGSLQLILIQNEITRILTNFGLYNAASDKSALKNTFSPKFDKLFWKTYEKILKNTPLTLTEIITFVTMSSFDSSLSVSSDHSKATNIAGNWEEFVVSVSAKLFTLLKTYKVVGCNVADDEIMKILWIKLLIRHLVLRDNHSSFLSRVVDILNHDVVEGYLHDSSSLELQHHELTLLGLSDQETISAYITENEMLKTIEIFKNV